jgi:hypothetical protein
MAKQRELASIVSSKIWRTVVVAGAMLGVPACGGGTQKPAPVAPAPGGDADGDAQRAADEQRAADDRAAADAQAAEDARLLAEKAAADKAAQEEADRLAQEEADRKTDEEAAKKRPRGGGNRPTGRGFILS